MKHHKRVLRRMRKFFCSSETWCQGEWAVDSSGNSVPVDHGEARAFCLQGRLSREVFEQPNKDKVLLWSHVHGHLAQAMIRKFPKHRQTGFPDMLMKFNDDPRTSFEDIQLLLDEGIVVARESPY